ncbi:polysaccharide biosynthesis protein [Winkia neuii]|nr:polysaccharide biosynthesis protein [Winkia neuii]
MAIQGVARFGYTWLIANFMGPEEVGGVNTVLSLAVYAALFWPQGAAVAAANYFSQTDLYESGRQVLVRTTSIALLASAFIGAIIAHILLGNVATTICSFLLVGAYGAYVFTRGSLLGKDRIDRAALWDTISSIAAIGLLVAAVLGKLHWALLLPLALGYGLFAAVNWPRAGTVGRSLPKAAVVGFVRDNSLAALANGGLLPATMVLVRAFDSATTAGTFAVAISLATPVNLFSQALNQVLVPHLSKIKDPAAAKAAQRHLFFLSAAFLIPLHLLLIAVSPWLVSLFFGTRYAAGTLPMQILLAIVMLISLTCVPSAYLVTTGRQKIYAKICLAAFAIGTVLLAILSPLLGQSGSLIGYAVGAGGGAVAVIVGAFRSAAA